MMNDVDFDALARKANQSGGATEDLNNLFGAAFALEKWLFIARGEMPNVNLYIASNAAYANNQPMIRAFTDSDRLNRFARENNLAKADGSVQMFEMPTGGIVDYLEKFTGHGVFGVWFNSDSRSDGFFIPLAQLRPIKEHLTKIGWNEANQDAPKASNAEDWGLGITQEGEIDLRVKFLEPGTINHNASVLPLVAAIQPLLREYRGADDYGSIFKFIPEAISEMDERFLSNEQGTHLRWRNFKYQPPPNTEPAEVITVDSNFMRHVKTGATLYLSFALLKIFGQRPAFYYGFEGNRGEVLKLIAAVKPKLDSYGFVAEKK